MADAGGRSDGPRDRHRERLQADGYRGGITILKDHLARVRPTFLATRAFQRTTYRPGEIGQVDWWHTSVQVPIGRGVRREARYGFLPMIEGRHLP